jgi:GNAT superfamily N-acetyltransferase
VVQRSIAGSRPYSVHAGGQQAAFARVVTDGATFAWIGDVFVDEHHRGLGLGTWLVRSILEDLRVEGLPRVVLGTNDAHEVYRRCGFTALERADRWMANNLRPTHAAVMH